MKLKTIYLAITATLMLSSQAYAVDNNKDYQLPQQLNASTNTNSGIVLEDVTIVGSNDSMNQQLYNYAKSKLVGTGSKNVTQMKQVASDMTDLFFKNNDYQLSRVYIPVQELDEKHPVLKIAVLQGKYGQITLNNPSHYNEKLIRSRLGIQSGDMLEAKKLEHGILLVEDLPGVKVKSINAVPGTNPGESDYTINVEKERSFSGAVLGDNQGIKATGKNRATAQMAYADLTSNGDELEAGVTNSGSGLTSGKIAYTIPFSLGNTQGWKASLAASKVNYKLVDPSLALLDSYGTAQGYSAAITYPLIRSRLTNMGFSTQVNYQTINDYLLGMEFNKKNSKSLSLGLSGDATRLYSKSLGATQFNWTAATTFGDLNIKNDVAKIADQNGPRTEGSYYRFNASGSLNQNLDSISNNLSLYTSLAGQYANKNLDSSEKLVLTGPNAVRGYAQGTVSADQALVSNNEIRYQLPTVNNLFATVYGFYDVGHGKVFTNQYAVGNNTQTVQALGVGISMQHKSGLFATATFSKGHGLKEVTGTNSSNKFAWVQLGYKF